MEWIKKVFIKDYKNVSNDKVRTAYGVVAGVVGIITNFILFVCKIVIGVISSSMSIIADAINSLSDMSSCIITIFGFKLSSKPADSDHPYGHARYEYLSSLLVAVIIFLIGILLLKSSIEKIIVNSVTEVNVITFVILIVSILLKLYQMLIYRNFGKSIDSDSLIVSSVDSRNDIISTFVVLISSVIIFFTKDLPVSIDGIFGCLVSIFIIVNSVMLLKDTLDPLLGEKPDEKLVQDIKDFINSYDGVCGIHDLMVHNYGAKVNFTVVHVEVSRDTDIMESHELMDTIEKDFFKKFNGMLTIHMDPIEIDNVEINDLKFKIHNILNGIDTKLDFHDFRMVKGVNNSNLIFDLVIPYELKIDANEVIDKINKELNTTEHNYNLVVNVDRA